MSPLKAEPVVFDPSSRAISKTIKVVAKKALEVCHYDMTAGQLGGEADLKNVDEQCEAGCYRCLLSYANQTDHKIIDRRYFRSA